MPERMEAVRRAAGQWQAQLIDESGRNRLLNYSDLKVGTLDLTPERTAPAGSPHNAPVILVPAAISPDGAGHWDYSLELSGDAQVNPVLSHVLRT